MTTPAPQLRRVRVPRRPRPVLRAFVAVGVLIVLAVLWVGVRGFLAKGHLERARTAITEARTALTSGNTAAAGAAVSKASHETKAAHAETSDFVWHLTSHLPLIGSTMRTASAVSTAADLVATQALPPLVDAATSITGKGLRTTSGAIDLTRVDAAASALTKAAPIIRRARLIAEGVPAARLAAVNSARTTLTAELARLETQLTLAGQAAQISGQMLAPGATRRYLVVLQNPAEARGTGGLLGTFAEITVTDGLIKLVQAGSDSQFTDTAAASPVTGLPPALLARWGSYGVAQDWREANLSPHFPWGAQAMTAYWRAHGGPALDGVIALDPASAGYLVDATGPVQLPDGETLSGSQIPTYVMSTQYTRFGADQAGIDARKAQLVDLVKTAFTRVAAGGGDPTTLLRALGRGASEGRIRVWSAHPTEQAELERTIVAGAIPTAPGPFAGLAIDNASGNKMDFYLDTALHYTASGCAGPTRASTIVATLSNTAPASGLPTLVAGQTDSTGATVVGKVGVVDGTDRSIVSIYAAVGATVRSVTVDGAAAGFATTTERDHTVVTGYLDVAPGQTRTVTVQLTEPTDGALGALGPLPLARPTQLNHQVGVCAADPFTVVTPLKD